VVALREDIGLKVLASGYMLLEKLNHFLMFPSLDESVLEHFAQLLLILRVGVEADSLVDRWSLVG